MIKLKHNRKKRCATLSNHMFTQETHSTLNNTDSDKKRFRWEIYVSVEIMKSSYNWYDINRDVFQHHLELVADRFIYQQHRITGVSARNEIVTAINDRWASIQMLATRKYVVTLASAWLNGRCIKEYPKFLNFSQNYSLCSREFFSWPQEQAIGVLYVPVSWASNCFAKRQ